MASPLATSSIKHLGSLVTLRNTGPQIKKVFSQTTFQWPCPRGAQLASTSPRTERCPLTVARLYIQP